MVSETLFQVTAADYFTDFKPKRVVLGLGTWILWIDVNHFLSIYLLLQQTRTAWYWAYTTELGQKQNLAFFRVQYHPIISQPIAHHRKFLVESISNNSWIKADYRKHNLLAEPLAWSKVSYWWKYWATRVLRQNLGGDRCWERKYQLYGGLQKHEAWWLMGGLRMGRLSIKSQLLQLFGWTSHE